MKASFPRKITALLAGAGIALASALPAAEVNLPDIGSPADAVLSKSDENRLGNAIMMEIRRRDELVEDPIVTEYVNEIGHRLAAQANADGDHRFSFFVVDNPVINAFALPGGYIGIHTGLLEATRNEDELAGVLGAAGGSSDAMQGAIAVAQGTAAQQQINFTRSNEYEADRVGIGALAAAGFDPQGMGSFFEVISRGTSPSQAQVPEFLRTHPVSSARIAEARGRARNYTPVHTADSVNYGIARARMIVASRENPNDAVSYFEREPYEFQSDVERYGRAVAYLRSGRNLEALRIFEELANKDSDVIAYHIGLADAQMANEAIAEAESTFENALALFPRNLPLTIHYAEALLRIGQAERAHAMLLDLLNNVPPTPEQVRLIARAAIEADEVAEANYYMAEYRFMIGDLVGGIQFLRQALRVPELDEIQRIRFEARIDFVREFMTEEQLQQLQRSRGIG